MSLLFPQHRVPPGEIERHLARQGTVRLLGVDEAGRGALCGPVVAAAVALPPGIEIPGLDDSKRLTAGRREAAAALVRSSALAVGVGEASAEEIDRLNILGATFLAMRRAIEQAVSSWSEGPELVLVDGPLAIRELALPQKPIVKGDCRSSNIAAASVIAKTFRDARMDELDPVHPGYGLSQHKGYGTGRHRDAIRNLGLSPIHRKTFCK
jgi:ribonuclease HII